MNSHYINFQEKDNLDLIDYADNCSSMTLDSKLALRALIQERISDGDIDNSIIEKLDSEIDKDFKEIKSLKFLPNLGIDLFEKNGEKVIKKSKKSSLSRLVGVIISSIMILFIVGAIYLWVDIVKFEFQVIKLFLAIILTIISGAGLLILIRIIDRISFYKNFLIARDNSRVVFTCKPDMRLEQIEYSSQANLIVEHKDNLTSLKIIDRDKTRLVLKYKNLGTVDLESLNSLVDRFNN